MFYDTHTHTYFNKKLKKIYNFKCTTHPLFNFLIYFLLQRYIIITYFCYYWYYFYVKFVTLTEVPIAHTTELDENVLQEQLAS